MKLWLALLVQGQMLLSVMKPCLNPCFSVPLKAIKEGGRRGEGKLSVCIAHCQANCRPLLYLSAHIFQNVQYYEFTPNFVCLGHTCHSVCSRKLVKNQVHYFQVLIDKVVQPELNRRYAAYNKEQRVYLPV